MWNFVNKMNIGVLRCQIYKKDSTEKNSALPNVIEFVVRRGLRTCHRICNWK